MAVKMIHANPYQRFQTSGAIYNSDASGVITAVALGDVVDMINSGCDLVAGPGVEAVGLWSNAGAPSNGTSGTLAGETAPGDLLVDSTNKTLYQNTNTTASPTWSLKASAGGGALTGTFDGVVGGVTPAAGTFTTLQSTGAATLATVNGIIGNVTPAAANVTTLGASGLASLASATLTGYFQGSVANALTAVGSSRTDALQLAKQYNVVTAAASTAVGVILPVGVIGMEVDLNVLVGVVATTIHVYANASETIDTVAGSTGVVLTRGFTCRYKFVAANTWVSSKQGLIST